MVLLGAANSVAPDKKNERNNLFPNGQIESRALFFVSTEIKVLRSGKFSVANKAALVMLLVVL